MSEKDIEENRQAIVAVQRAIDAFEVQLSAVAATARREGGENSQLNRKITDLVEKFKVYVSRNDVLLSTMEDRMGKMEGSIKETHETTQASHHEVLLLKGRMEGAQQAEATGQHQLAHIRAEIDRAVPQSPGAAEKEESGLKAFMKDNGPLMGLIGIITVLVNLVARLVENLVP